MNGNTAFFESRFASSRRATLSHTEPEATSGERANEVLSPSVPNRSLQAALRCSLLAAMLAGPVVRGAEESPVTRLFDTGKPSSGSLAPEAVVRLAGARQIPEDQTNVTFAGDAVLMNDKLAVVFPKTGGWPEVHAKTADGFKRRAVLSHSPERYSGGAITRALDPRDRPGALKIIENTPGGVELELAFSDPTQSALRLRLTAGEAILEVRSTGGSGFIEWEANARYVVVPDFFGDDMVYEAAGSRGSCLPTENLCLQLLEGGDAMIMAVWRSREQEVWLAAWPTLSGKPRPALVHSLKDQSLWLAFIESPRLWQTLPEPAKVTTPFPAKWRTSYLRTNNEADSWDLEHGPSAEQTAGKRAGPALVYPIDRSTATPLTATCPTDVMRNTLGVGPCQYILACEGMGAQGDPTPNSVMGWVEKQFEQKKDKKAVDEIKERLEVMTKHIAEARARIQGYSSFAVQAQKTLESGSGQDFYQPILDRLRGFAASGLVQEARPEVAREIAAQVLALIGREDSLAGCRQAGERLRAIGAVQDRALATSRMAVRRLKAEGRLREVIAQARGDGVPSEEILRQAEAMLKTQ